MTERDLENLSKWPVPPPSANAKRAAFDAALQAFDASNKALPAGSPEEDSEATTKATQGTVRTLRQTETTQSKRSFRMPLSTRQGQALAASLAALVVVAPFAFHQLSTRGLPTPGPVEHDIAALNGRITDRPAPARTREMPRADGAVAVTPPALEKKVVGDKGADAGAAASQAAARGGQDEENASGNTIASGAVGAKPAEPAAPAAADAKTDAPSSVGAQVGLGEDTGARTESRKTEIVTMPAPHAPAQSSRGVGESEAASAFVQAPQSAPENAATVASLTPQPSKPAHADRLAAAQPAPYSGKAKSFLGGADRLKLNDELAWMRAEADARDHAVIDQEENRDTFDAKEINPVKQAASEPVSTFSIDVDTASYSFVRRALNAGHLPPKDAVRVEELINYFPYSYPAPETAEMPFKPTVSVFSSPWNTNNKLVHVAIKGYDLKSAERPRANLVFLVDVSGSMAGEDRLPLVKNAFRLLADQLKPDDTIGIVTYASGSGIALEATKGSDKNKILAAIDKLSAGGSTAGAAGIADAYRMAEAGFDKAAVNRIILATDGDFNVGITSQDELKGFVERKRQSGIFLSILGVGQGNHNDALMQALAQNGNGTAAYVDTLSEARKVLVDEASSTLFTIAKDVKIQVEWNPQAVSEYRLIGYETRNLKREDFNNDRVDAGDIGSGHTVTAIYEVTPVGAPKLVDDLRYGAKAATKASVEPPHAATAEPLPSELGFLKLRFKRPKEDVSQLVSLPIPAPLAIDPKLGPDAPALPVDVRFSTAVAAFGQMLKGEPYTQSYSFDDVLALAQGARGDDPFGYRAEFLNLVRLAKSARP